MESALVVSGTEKSTAYFSDLLNAASIQRVVTLKSCGEARRLVLERDFDLILINAPLQDESGERFARHIVSSGMTQAILVVKSEYFDAVAAACEGDGVLTVAKPISRAILWSALMLAKAAHGRIRKIQAENTRLKQEIEDIRIIDRAKCALVSALRMSEQEAHRYIGKQAMDRRATKRAIAEGILKTYE